MYAIVESGGKQFKVRRDGRVRVPRLDGEVGDRVTFERVLYVAAEASSGGDEAPGSFGRPFVGGARVVGEIVRHGRGPKIVVFKYKRRHRYRRKRGHRQDFTEVAIRELALGDGGAAAGEGGDSAGEHRQSPEVPLPDTAGESEAGARQVGPYVCEDCGRGFATERGLQQHRAKAHVE